jgi:signal transduction histidine kinase
MTDIAARQSWYGPTLRFGRTRYVLTLAALVAAYAGAAQLSFALQFAGPVAAIAWLPVGIGVAFTYFGGLWLLPGVLIGDLLANDYTALPLGSAIGQSAGNVLEVAVATVLLWRLVRHGSPLDSVAGVGSMLVAVCMGVAVSATVGTLSLWLGGVVVEADAGSVWGTWWLGDVCGALLVLPLALAWHPARAIRWSVPRLLEGAAMIAFVAVLSEVPSRTQRPLVYIVFPPVIWAALRFGPRGGTLALGVAAGVTIVNATHFHGVFVSKSLSHSVHEIQLFIAVSVVTTLFLAAAVSERRRYARDLAQSRVRILEAARLERKRLERDLHDGAQQRLTWLAVSLHDAADAASPERARPLLHHAEEEVEKAIEELRNLAHGLHPALTDLGLGPAVRSVALRTTIPMVSIDIPDVRVDERVEAAAYFVFAEAAANAQKHSGAGSIRVSGTLSPHALRLEVADDGRGGADEDGTGIQGMRDRVETLGGTLAIESPPGRGTRIVATLPLEVRPGRVR